MVSSTCNPSYPPLPFLQNISLCNIFLKLIPIPTPPLTTPSINIPPPPSHTSYILFSNHPSLPCFSSLFYLSNPIFTNNNNLLILFHPHNPHSPFTLFFLLPIITTLLTTFYYQKHFLTLIYHPYLPLYLSNIHTTPSHPHDTIPTSPPTILLKILKNNSPIIWST
jgi:hypothetical protein